MGVNMVGFCISDDKVCCEASKQEIIRRYYSALNDLAAGKMNEAEINKIKLLFGQSKIYPEYRKTVVEAHYRATNCSEVVAAIELEDGTIITAEAGELLGSSAALILNATKHLAGVEHSIKLIPQDLIEPIQNTKINILGGKNPRLHTDEVLVALSICSRTDENCRRCLEVLPKLRGCQMHSTAMLSEVDRKIFKKLGVDVTCDPIKK